jgi:hypothetical protein
MPLSRARTTRRPTRSSPLNTSYCRGEQWRPPPLPGRSPFCAPTPPAPRSLESGVPHNAAAASPRGGSPTRCGGSEPARRESHTMRRQRAPCQVPRLLRHQNSRNLAAEHQNSRNLAGIGIRGRTSWPGRASKLAQLGSDAKCRNLKLRKLAQLSIQSRHVSAASQLYGDRPSRLSVPPLAPYREGFQPWWRQRL